MENDRPDNLIVNGIFRANGSIIKELPENSKLDIDWEIKITITNGKKKMKAKINLDDYIAAFGLHGVSLVDETIDILLKEIDKSVIKETKL